MRIWRMPLRLQMQYSNRPMRERRLNSRRYVNLCKNTFQTSSSNSASIQRPHTFDQRTTGATHKAANLFLSTKKNAETLSAYAPFSPSPEPHLKSLTYLPGRKIFRLNLLNKDTKEQDNIQIVKALQANL